MIGSSGAIDPPPGPPPACRVAPTPPPPTRPRARRIAALVRDTHGKQDARLCVGYLDVIAGLSDTGIRGRLSATDLITCTSTISCVAPALWGPIFSILPAKKAQTPVFALRRDR